MSLPDIDICTRRILEAREEKERVVIFGDYDVDGVSGTAILVKFFTEIGIETSYRLPHRVHDGYGLKSYFFDELVKKDVKLVVTVDCGTRDVEPIRYAKSLGIDVIVTDHHAVPEIVPEEVVWIINPKRSDSKYPFQNLAWAGVAFKLVHALAIQLGYTEDALSKLLLRFVDIAALWTVSDCMPLVGENRIITTLGLRQMKNSESAGLRKFLEWHDKVEWNADIIGFQIWPRINASGRMDTPLTALRWLLASEDRCDEFLAELEELNGKRQTEVKTFTQKALETARPEEWILFFIDTDNESFQKHEAQGRKNFSKGVYKSVNDWEKFASDDEIHDFSKLSKLEHGLIGLVAGKLTETYNRPSIVLCDGHVSSWKREYEKDIQEKEEVPTFVASCRSPEWCNLVELLDECKEFFVRYGGHKQAAGFTIETHRFEEFQNFIQKKFQEKYSLKNLPEKIIRVEASIPPTRANLETLSVIEKFEPFGIGNPKPLWLFENITLTEVKPLGKEWKHLTLKCKENPNLKMILWNAEKISLCAWDITSLIVELSWNEWNGNISVQGIVKYIIKT